ncbi:MAG: cytidylate kinase-like family protein [Lachnospiraceae bacterium]|nr:cytidylate kinase-like family protein [Lachnospiraceae bacterium]
MKLSKNFHVTIGREYGSGGKAIAEALGEDLGIKVFDKNIIQMISEQHNIDPDVLEATDEHISNPFFDPYISYGIDTASRSSRLFALQSRIIRDAANEGPAIFVGRCADDILWEFPDVVNIFIYAPKADRVKRIMKKENITEDLAAEKIIRRMDKARRTYYQFYTDKKWGTPEGMDLMINSSALGIEGTVGLIEDFLILKGYIEK